MPTTHPDQVLEFYKSIIEQRRPGSVVEVGYQPFTDVPESYTDGRYAYQLWFVTSGGEQLAHAQDNVEQSHLIQILRRHATHEEMMAEVHEIADIVRSYPNGDPGAPTYERVVVTGRNVELYRSHEEGDFVTRGVVEFFVGYIDAAFPGE